MAITIIKGKQRRSGVNTTTLVAGYFENIVKDEKGNILSRDWKPQLIKDVNDNEIPITVQVPIEGQHNNGLGVDYYLKKGYLPLLEAERKLDELGIKYQKFTGQQPIIEKPAEKKPELIAEKQPQNILKPKRGRPAKAG